LITQTPTFFLIETARRRLLRQNLLDRGALAAACGLAGLLFLVVAGTQILRWWWPVLLLGGALAWAVWSAIRRLPDPYQVAQELDRRMGLKDLLSTAFHFAAHRSDARNARVIDAVSNQAEAAAARLDLQTALPATLPRSALAAFALLVAVGAAFGLRYGMLRTFDLSRPLLAVQLDPLATVPDSVKQSKRSGKQPDTPEFAGFTLPDADRAAQEENERAIEEQLRSFDIESPNQVAVPGPKGDKRTAPSQQSSDAGEEFGNERSSSKENPSLTAGGEPPSSAAQSKKGAKPQEKNSLLDKMRDAMANLMEKLKLDSQGNEPQEASSKSGQTKGDGQQQGQNQKGSQSQGQQQAKGDPNQAQEGEQAGEAADSESSQMAKGNQMQEQPTNNPKSGVGKSDGNKDVELAEQLEAMGKLSELLSKRAEKIQGEMMVEVSSTRNQQARTPYSSKSAAHSGAGGELVRDEVPLHLQHYVQKYYEQVRKPASKPQSGARQ
jgi:hypothetical protein